ncbi:hypothetical protein EZS27_008232 [termite gut metagenome]|jgi:hypothetical protein|uniref:Uncharacterized protein n=1 Tax=termite gut metagenome TaxID=433724 RepID=A0A5J4SFM5_9ZZZZ
MFYTLLITLLIVAISALLLGIKIIFLKDGKFPNGHVSGSKALRDKGISCVQSQDKEARAKQCFSLTDM